ncbi:MAG: DUF1501 domain-containing protein [Planctomycetota bacterium]|nr:MAG: DUF1501 domain-containing protein [Planctomycetota bacterium]
MLSFWDCDPRSRRRNFLQAGSLALGGLQLTNLLQQTAHAAGSSAVVKDKSVIFLFLHGGPGQTETFDPKMTAPVGIQSVTGEVQTKIPGITFGGTFPRLAGLADKLSIVRSFVTGDGNHDIKPIVSRDTLNANLGSLYARVAGTNREGSGIPTNVALFPQAVVHEAQPAVTNFGDFTSTGVLGSGYRPFVPGAQGEAQENMRLQFDRSRLDDRRLLLKSLDAIRRSVDESGALNGLDRIQQQAFDAIVGGVADAFDLSKEDQATVHRYDTAPLMRADDISRKWNNHKNYVDNAQSLGKLLLLARRMCEAGCGFVTVTTNFVWDMHADVNNAGMEEGMRYMGGPLDHALSALIEDIHQRGLDDRIMVLACGEMGRTPRINAGGGRDHWGGLAPLLISGGGLNMGQVIGQSTRDAAEAASNPVRIPNLISTILHTVFDVGQLRLQPGLPRELSQQLVAADPIPGL